MSDQATEPAVPEIIVRSNNFNTVTTPGNKVATKLAETAGKDPETIIQEIKKHVPELLQNLISVLFEKAKLWPIIEKEDDLVFYRKLDFKSWITPPDVDTDEMHQAKVESSLASLVTATAAMAKDVQKCKKEIRTVAKVS